MLVDSNLLLLYFVGAYNPERISTFKGTYSRGFGEDDFDLLIRLFSVFDRIVTTPNILTEVSNLSNQLRRDEKQTYYADFARQMPLLTEHYTESKEISVLQHFIDFGLTDSGIINLARENFLVLTDDGPLVGYLQNVGIDAINFNHVRSLNWGLS
ncbi:MAG TPA: PIN domain-containing protein [Blastocatellia bacterium]|nr:PIN domain-containing protein [Blastocatellia bacterium]